MEFSGQQTGLVIIGANPTGLLLAAQLLNFGLQPVIFDSKSSDSKASPTLSLDSATLDIFNQLGLLEELMKAGVECRGMVVQLANEVVGSIAYYEDNKKMEFPFHFNISQNKLEDILINYLAVRACPIHWDVKVLDFNQDSAGVKLAVLRGQELLDLAVKWLVVAEKKQFDVKRFLSINYNSWSFRNYFYRAVIQTKELYNHNKHLSLYNRNFVLSSPVNREGEYEFIGSFTNKGGEGENLKEIREVLHRSLGFSIPIKSYSWINSEILRASMASEYVKQHCILLGDSTFDRSAIIRDETNIAIQDAYNLGWKLANVFIERQAVSILNTYQEERQHLAKREFKKEYWLSCLFKIYVLLPLKMQRYLIKSALKRNTVLSKPSNCYSSSLSLNHSLGKKVKAGDRLPFLPVYDEKKMEHTDLHKWCRKPGFILLLLGNLSSNSLFIMAQWMKQKYTQHMHLFYLPYSERNNVVFEAFEVKPEKNKMILIRPDMHIGYMHDVVGANLIDTYMVEIMKWRF